MENAEIQALLENFGKNLRRIRKQNAMTLEDVSAHSGIDPSDIAKIERGEINLAFSTIVKIANGLNTSPAVLFTF